VTPTKPALPGIFSAMLLALNAAVTSFRSGFAAVHAGISVVSFVRPVEAEAEAVWADVTFMAASSYVVLSPPTPKAPAAGVISKAPAENNPNNLLLLLFVPFILMFFSAFPFFGSPVSILPKSATRTVGSTVQLQTTVVVGPNSVLWSSSNITIATVNNSGLVTGKTPGVAAITAAATAYPLARGTANVLFGQAEGTSIVNRTYARWYLEREIGWPLGNLDNNTSNRSYNLISSRYGPRSLGTHCGIDIVCPKKAGWNENDGKGGIGNIRLLAVADGVIRNKQYLTGTGNMVQIVSTIRDPSVPSNTNGEGYLIFTYMHMRNEARVNNGDTVKKGDWIGIVGDTEATGNVHLHFEVSNYRYNVNFGIGPYEQSDGDEARRRTRIIRRIDPVFFYPAGTFVVNRDNPTSSFILWPEITWSIPW